MKRTLLALPAVLLLTACGPDVAPECIADETVYGVHERFLFAFGELQNEKVEKTDRGYIIGGDEAIATREDRRTTIQPVDKGPEERMTLALENIRTVGSNEAAGNWQCEADFVLIRENGDRNALPVEFTSDITDEGVHHLSGTFRAPGGRTLTF